MRGSIDVEGDPREARHAQHVRRPAPAALRVALRAALHLRAGGARQEGIAAHYDYEQDFYLLWLDSRHRCYSQGIFAHGDEPVEDAMTRKLEFAIDAVGAKPGDRVLDIGGGWGAFTEHAGRKGIRVTSLTISAESERFLNGLVAREGLPCTVLLEHLFEHRTAEKYDAIVNRA